MVVYLGSSAQTTITIVSLEVGTNLSINAPAQAVQGAPFTIYGFLTRVDTFAGINGATITLTYNGTPLGSVVTSLGGPGGIPDADGWYALTANIDVPGTFTLTASFAGMEVAGLTLMPSNAFRGIGTTGLALPIPLLLIAGLAAYAMLKQ